jgi:ubiquinone/menaquinone biosynthesis C-methylase UbiE
LHLSKLINSLLALFFQLLYNQFAWTYNIVAQSVSLGMWYQWVNTALPYLDQEPILELGFGTGELLVQLYKRGLNTVGVDLSMYMANRVKSGLSKKGISQKLVNGNAQNLPFRNHSFKRIASTFPSTYILERQTWLEIWRVLSPGGLLVIIPTAWITGKSILNKLAAGLFQVTHQTPSSGEKIEIAYTEFAHGLETIGFIVQKRTIELPHSQVMCILAEKPR